MGGYATPSTLISHLEDGIMIRLHPCSCSHILHCCMKFDTRFRIQQHSTTQLPVLSDLTELQEDWGLAWLQAPSQSGLVVVMLNQGWQCGDMLVVVLALLTMIIMMMVMMMLMMLMMMMIGEEEKDKDKAGSANSLHKILFFTFPRKVHSPSETAQERIQHLIFSPTEP